MDQSQVMTYSLLLAIEATITQLLIVIYQLRASYNIEAYSYGLWLLMVKYSHNIIQHSEKFSTCKCHGTSHTYYIYIYIYSTPHCLGHILVPATLV